jgi:hypothetical protein
MLLIAWRVLRLAMDFAAQWRAGDMIASGPAPAAISNRPDLALLLAGMGWFVAINMIAGTEDAWKPTALAVLLLLFSLGAWTVDRSIR